MATTIFKETIRLAEIRPDDTVTLYLPAFAEILTIAEQFADSGFVSLWHRCVPTNGKTLRTIYIIGTGNPAPVKANARYISTVILKGGALVLHFFEEHLV